MLDPYPFGGCNTSFEAFDLGIPVVTMPTKYLNGRFTFGMYKKMGFIDMVADSPQNYVKIALKAGMDKRWRESIKDKIMRSKHLLFQDSNAIKNWSDFLIQIHENNLVPSSTKQVSNQVSNQPSNQVTEQSTPTKNIKVESEVVSEKSFKELPLSMQNFIRNFQSPECGNDDMNQENNENDYNYEIIRTEVDQNSLNQPNITLETNFDEIIDNICGEIKFDDSDFMNNL
jgi:hypothetical protein